MIRVKIGHKEYSVWGLIVAVTGVIGLSAATVANASKLADAWDHVAPVRRAVHLQEVRRLESKIGRLESLIGASLQAANEETAEFRDEWKCDEYREELRTLLEKVDADTATAADEERIRVIRIKMGTGENNYDCSRFED